MRGRARRLGAAAGLLATFAGAGLGTVMLIRSGGSPLSARHLSTEPPPVTVPLSDAEIVGLLSRPLDLGALDDAHRRSSCLSGLGYSTSDTVLGARRVDIAGTPAVVLVLPGDTSGTLAALAVRPNCSSADTGLLADTRIRRP